MPAEQRTQGQLVESDHREQTGYRPPIGEAAHAAKPRNGLPSAHRPDAGGVSFAARSMIVRCVHSSPAAPGSGRPERTTTM